MGMGGVPRFLRHGTRNNARPCRTVQRALKSQGFFPDVPWLKPPLTERIDHAEFSLELKVRDSLPSVIYA